MSHSLGLRVIAEGVETRSQLDYLRDNQCDAVQGFILSEPLEVAAMQSLLESD